MMLRTLALPGLDLDGRTSLQPRPRRAIMDQFDHRTLAGMAALGYSDLETGSHPEILSAVQAAAAARGFSLSCREEKNPNPFSPSGFLYNRVCTAAGSPDQYDADIIYSNPEGLDVGIQITMSNVYSAGGGGSLPASYNPQAPVGAANTPGSVWTPSTPTAVYQTAPIPVWPAETPASRALEQAQPPASTTSNPAPQTALAPTTQPGEITKPTPPVVNNTAATQTGGLLGNIDTNTLLLIGAGIVALVLLKR